MTKNKALKTAARERVAQTGERYVVARRAIASQPTAQVEGAQVEGVLHRLTHLVPGVPQHVEGGIRTRPNRPHRPQTQFTARHGEPRVLVGLQHRIARLFRAE